MGFFKWLLGESDPVVKSRDGIETRQSGNKHCGVCGFNLSKNDYICPACGGDPISADEDWEDEEY